MNLKPYSVFGENVAPSWWVVHTDGARSRSHKVRAQRGRTLCTGTMKITCKAEMPTEKSRMSAEGVCSDFALAEDYSGDEHLYTRQTLVEEGR